MRMHERLVGRKDLLATNGAREVSHGSNFEAMQQYRWTKMPREKESELQAWQRVEERQRAQLGSWNMRRPYDEHAQEVVLGKMTPKSKLSRRVVIARQQAQEREQLMFEKGMHAKTLPVWNAQEQIFEHRSDLEFFQHVTSDLTWRQEGAARSVMPIAQGESEVFILGERVRPLEEDPSAAGVAVVLRVLARMLPPLSTRAATNALVAVYQRSAPGHPWRLVDVTEWQQKTSSPDFVRTIHLHLCVSVHRRSQINLGLL